MRATRAARLSCASRTPTRPATRTEATEVILSGLRWLGLNWDEGPASADPTAPGRGDYGPYFQSQRGEFYRRRVQELMDKGLAYESEGAVKFKMPREPVLIPDLVVGNVRARTDRPRGGDPDFVIVRSDGQPVFHLVNVVDDLEMKITHVIRGEDHLSNTAKHIALFRAFGVEPPQYAHIPLILNPDGAKMSKRDQGASLRSYMDEGSVPEAVVNYLCLLGWSPKDNREKMPMEEIIRLFDLPQILRHNARFDLNKLRWLDAEYIREMGEDRFRELGAQALERAGVACQSNYSAGIHPRRPGDLPWQNQTFRRLARLRRLLFHRRSENGPAAAAKEFTPENRERLRKFSDALSHLPEFTAPAIEQTLKAVAAELGVKAGVLVHPTRLACTGNTAGPSLYHLMEVLGRERVLKRLAVY